LYFLFAPTCPEHKGKCGRTEVGRKEVEKLKTLQGFFIKSPNEDNKINNPFMYCTQITNSICCQWQPSGHLQSPSTIRANC